ncbi:hypothetical protein PG993_013180 [Apiospora rasikravindrae]|uniref:MAPEG family protein n=1 Tax=Apiospora rasikravindrae TaxID=990691 RepID=A0ABR1RWZ4_9PEZI
MAEKQTAEVHGTPKGQSAITNGIRNPKGIRKGIISLAFLGLIPVTDYLARTGPLHWLLRQTVALIPGCASAAASEPTSGRMIPALSALYLFVSYGASGALSLAGQAMARPEGEGVDASHPRRHVNDLEGFPLRLRSAHYGLLENFPAFALAAALAQTLRPGDPHMVGLLGLHVVGKVFVYYPAYLADVPALRGVSHILAMAAVINVCWRLATAAVVT